ncbi:DUF982 domain-containing protein [Rhizobium sp. BK313]|uniref:DUF982 domain-containing protein n=1 Tax=Rhizobium sp. BK313 TaxID=2587081 RepID=UPI0039182B68
MNGTERVAECMLQQWPRREFARVSPRQNRRLYAHDGRLTSAEARAAFLSAAEEAQIFFFKE